MPLFPANGFPGTACSGSRSIGSGPRRPRKRRNNAMSRVCELTGKGPMSGNNISHANNKTRRRWQPNLQVCSFPSEILGKPVRLRLTANGIRTVEHNGGIDAWVMGSRKSRLSEEALKVRKTMEKAIARKASR